MTQIVQRSFDAGVAPPLQCIRRDQGTDILEDFPTDWIGFDSQTATLVVVERWAILAHQFMKCAVFFHEKLDDSVLRLG